MLNMPRSQALLGNASPRSFASLRRVPGAKRSVVLPGSTADFSALNSASESSTTRKIVGVAKRQEDVREPQTPLSSSCAYGTKTTLRDCLGHPRRPRSHAFYRVAPPIFPQSARPPILARPGKSSVSRSDKRVCWQVCMNGELHCWTSQQWHPPHGQIALLVGQHTTIW
jgi:hypothetical protein